MNLRRSYLLISALLAFLCTNDCVAENWDRFRGPNGAGQSDATGIPSEWKPENILWKQPLPGIGHSSPVIWGDRIFVTSADNDTGEQIIQAFDTATGTPLWERHAEASTYSMNALNSHASSTPAVDKNRLYGMWLADGRIQLAAWSHDGEPVWQKDIGAFEEEHGFGKSPIVVDDLVVVVNDNEMNNRSEIVAVDSATGDVRWKISRPTGVTPFASPCLLESATGNKLLLALSTTSGLTAIEPASGKVVWQGLKEELPLRTVSSPIIAEGLIFVACGQGGNGKLMIAAHPGNSTHPPKEVYRLEKNIPNVPTPVVAGNLLFLWHDRGVVSCHDLATGKQHWRERVGGDFSGSPIRIGNRIFGISRQGEVIVLAASPNFELIARNELDEPFHATPAVSNNRLYLRSENTLFCIGTPTPNGK